MSFQEICPSVQHASLDFQVVCLDNTGRLTQDFAMGLEFITNMWHLFRNRIETIQNDAEDFVQRAESGFEVR